MSRGDLFKKLPAVYTSWFDLKLAPVLRAASGSQRSWRLARTLCEIIDTLLGGDVMYSLMVALGRLNAVTDVASNDGITWAVAAHHELVVTDAVGLVTRRSRANQAIDQREALKTQGAVRGSALPAAS